jgi:putative membrane protein
MALRDLLASAALIGLMAQPALAQSQDRTQQQPAQAEQQRPSQAGQQQLAQEDIEFATEAAEGGIKEVRVGELAQQKATTPEVQQFGQRMVQDHGKANEQLMQIAQEKGIELPKEMPAEAQQLHDELQQKSGAEFDQSYMDDMVSDHQKDVDEFKQYVETGQDPDLKSFAEQTLPILEEHLQLAQETQQQVTAAAGQGEQPDATAQQQSTEQQAATQPEEQVNVEEVLGSQVVNTNGEEVAEIEDLVMDQNQDLYAVLSVGGFLGIGEKRVAVPLEDLQLSEDQVYLMTAATEEQLEQMPEYDEQQFQPYAQR